MVVRFDGEEIRWPEPTHGKPGSPEVLSGKRRPWRTAAEIIDWSIHCPSIFDRKKPLAEKTLRRIAHGIMKFVVNNPAPFIVPLTHHQAGARGASVDQPMATVTGANRGEHAIVMPHVTKFRSGATGHGIEEPLHTVTANSFVKRPGGSAPLGLVEVAAAPFATYAQQGGANRSLEEPHHTVTASNKDQNCVAAAHLVHIGNGEREGQTPRAMDVEAPLGTVVAAWLGGSSIMRSPRSCRNSPRTGRASTPASPCTLSWRARRAMLLSAPIWSRRTAGPTTRTLLGERLTLRCQQLPLQAANSALSPPTS